jgi:uncharacterized Ntn-hydrolase superfamily protein
MTFSIVAWDPQSSPAPEWGVAVASKFLSVGAVVPWARAGVGAVATQALANIAYGRDGLDLLASGRDANAVVEVLTTQDGQRAERQLGVVDGSGGGATFTGSSCMHWAGGRTGDGYACQGNILTGPEVVDAMAATFESERGSLTTRLLAAVRAGDVAGGDSRGRQGAAVKVVREGGGYGGGTDLAVDLRVDDHQDPVAELSRLWDLHRLYFPSPDDLDFISIDPGLAGELRELLAAAGAKVKQGDGYDSELERALSEWAGVENLEERLKAGPYIDATVVEYLRGKSTD